MRIKSAVLSLLSVSALVLTGCSLQQDAVPTQLSAGAISGTVHGGQQPVSGARVYVLAANATTYAGNSTSLLQAGSGINVDSIGFYATTDSTGSFNLPAGSYTCTSGQIVYVLAEQGNPGLTAGTNNASIALMTPLGVCGGSGNFTASLPTIGLNEVTTVAAVYALAPYMSGPTNLGSSNTTAGVAGLTNAVNTAYNMVDMVHGQARATTIAGNGTIPKATINTLANILAACINTDGTNTSGTACYKLFHSVNATATLPTDTITALLAYAHFPAQAIDLGGGFTTNDGFTLSSSNAPFQPALTSKPNDWTIEIPYSGSGISGAITSPKMVAIDASGDIWTVNPSTNSISAFDPQGAPLGNFTGTGSQAITGPTSIAIDNLSRIWVPNSGTSATISVFNTNGNAAAISPVTGLVSPADIAFDGSGNAWLPNNFSTSIQKVSSNGATVNSFTGNGLSVPVGVAVQPGAAGNVWVVNQSSGNVVSVFTNAGGVVAAYPTGDTGSYVSDAIDVSGNVWITNATSTGGLTKMSSTGVLATGSPFTSSQVNHGNSVRIGGTGNVWVSNSTTGENIRVFTSTGGQVGNATGGLVSDVVPSSLAIDGSGNVWFRSETDGFLRELVGAANPVVTPLAKATANSQLGSRP